MKKYLHKKEVSIPLYRGKLLIFLTNNAKQLQKYISDFDDAEPYGHSIVINWNGKQAYAVILNFHYKHRNITHGTITHEAVHVANFIAADRGFEADFNNDEPIAYLADWITDEIYQFVEQHDLKFQKTAHDR